MVGVGDQLRSGGGEFESGDAGHHGDADLRTVPEGQPIVERPPSVILNTPTKAIAIAPDHNPAVGMAPRSSLNASFGDDTAL